MSEIPPHEALEKAMNGYEERNSEQETKLKRYRQREKELTEKLNRLQRDLIKSERLAVIGGLAIAIAHEVNSPLQAIGIIVETLRKNPTQDRKFCERIDLLKETLGNMRCTVRKLLDLNHPWEDEKVTVDINLLLQKTTKLFRVQLKRSGVKLNLDLGLGIPNVPAVPQQLSHVFLNLLNNAHEAITAEREFHTDGELFGNSFKIDVRSRCGDRKVIIQIADNGPGIPEDVLEHVFDPFFSQKNGSGTGLGLSLSLDLVQTHGGTMTAKNDPAEGGAVFTVELPFPV